MITATNDIPAAVLRRLPQFYFAEDSDSTASGAVRLHPDDLAAIMNAVRVQTPWMNTQEAAEYLRCPPSRVYKLSMTGELPHEKDGSRLLFHRDGLDEYIRAGGAKSV